MALRLEASTSHINISRVDVVYMQIRPKLTSNAVHVAAAGTRVVGIAVVTATVDGRHESVKCCGHESYSTARLTHEITFRREREFDVTPVLLFARSI